MEIYKCHDMVEAEGHLIDSHIMEQIFDSVVEHNGRFEVEKRGIRVIPESKERDRLAFAFMSNGISSERQVETSVRQTVALMRNAREGGQKIIVVAGPVVVHTGGAGPLSSLIREGWVDA